MDSNFQALFTHLNPTEDQLKAILQDLWRKNDEKQKEISKIREENFAKSMEIIEMNRKVEALTGKVEALTGKVEALTEENELLKMIKTCDDISCSVCLQNFDEEDHQPYVLSCPHVICAECLFPALVRITLPAPIPSGWSSATLNNAHMIQNQNHPSKRCPVCREPVTTKLKKVCLRS